MKAKNRSLLILLTCVIAVALLCACGNSGAANGTVAAGAADEASQAASVETGGTVAESAVETENQEPVSEESSKLCTFSLGDAEVTLPIPYTEFAEKTGFNYVKTSIETEYTEETIMPSYTTVPMVYKDGDDTLVVLLANQTEKEIPIKDSEVIGFKITRVEKEPKFQYSYQGTDWESSYEELKEQLGDPMEEEENRIYHLVSYTHEIDDHFNVQSSFVCDDEQTHSVALSLNNTEISYKSLDYLAEITE